MWNKRQILLLILSVVVVEPRPTVLQEELPRPPLVPFNFGYEVSAEETGDTKSHQESLEDGVLRGSYTVVQPDGFLRVVNYVSDAENGFRADVTFEKGYEHVIPKPGHQKASGVSADSTDSTSLSQVSSNLSSAKTASSSSANLEIGDSLSAENSATTQGLTSTGFTSPLVQISDIAKYGNAQFAPSIDSSLSGESSVQESILTNNEAAATSSGSEIHLDTANLNSANEGHTNNFESPRTNNFEHFFTNTQVFCAHCKGGNFESSNVISDSNIAPVHDVNTLIVNSENTVGVVGNIAGGEPTAEVFTAGESSTAGGSSAGVGSNIADIFSHSFLVASENLGSIDAVELANAGFNTDQLYAYKLVPVQILKDTTTV